MNARRHLAGTALVAALAACAHAPAARTRPAPAVAWPEPPEPPRARLVGVIPDPGAPPPARPWWAVLVGWITGGEVGIDRPTLQRPFGLAVGADGAVYVADPDSSGVYRVGSGGTLEPIRCGAAEWGAPMALAFSGTALYVADAGLAAIARVRDSGCTLLGAGALERPTGLAVRAGRVFVADPPRHRIVVLSEGGEVLARWGAEGSGEGRFAFPTSVALAENGDLVVTDALNFRVARLDAEGRWVSAFGSPGDAGAGFARPKGIAVDGDGRIYVSDAQRDLVLVFARAGELLYTIGAPGEEPGRFALPSGLAVAAGRLYVADSRNARVQVIELVGGRP